LKTPTPTPNPNPDPENLSTTGKTRAETAKPANENEVTTGFGVELNASKAKDPKQYSVHCRLCEDLKPLIAEFEQATGCNFEILQVKEKFGGLSFYVNDANDAIREHIEAAKLESLPGEAFAELESSLGC